MRSHSALYVDAGYLLSATATRLTGSSLRRGVEVQYAPLIASLTDVVQEHSALPLLRVYWYDAARDGKATPAQEQIALLDNVKLRLGRIGVDGEQKGVDLRIGLDLAGHSRAGRIDAMYLLSGDDDLTEAVEEAQAQGVRVVVLAVPSVAGSPQGVSRHLLYAADSLRTLNGSDLDRVIGPASVPEVSTPSREAQQLTSNTDEPPTPGTIAHLVAPGGGHFMDRERAALLSESDQALAPDTPELAQRIGSSASRTYAAWSVTATPTQLLELQDGRPEIPRDLDRALLVDLSAALGEYALSDSLRVRLRAHFWKSVDTHQEEVDRLRGSGQAVADA